MSETVSRRNEHHDPEGTWLVPRGAVTGVGSLPTSDPAQAIAFIAEYAPILPFCPQPPTPDLLINTLDQQLDPFSGSEEWLQQFANAVRHGAFPRASALKSQLTGPITLAGLLGVAGWKDPSGNLLRDLAEHVGRRAVHHHRVLRDLGLPILIVVDEPAVVLMDPLDSRPQQLLNDLLRRIRGAGARTGVHCCSITEPHRLASDEYDVISFDASTDVPLGLADAHVLRHDHRTIAFGLIGVAPTPESPRVAFSRWLAAASLVEDPRSLAARTIVTTRCGLGRSTMAEAEAAFRAASDTGSVIGQVANAIDGSLVDDASDELLRARQIQH